MDEHRIAVIMKEFSQSINKINVEHFSKMMTIISENQKQMNKWFEQCLAVFNDGAVDAHAHEDPQISAPEHSDNADPDDDFNCDDADVLSGLEFVEDENELNADIDETDVIVLKEEIELVERKNRIIHKIAPQLFDKSSKKEELKVEVNEVQDSFDAMELQENFLRGICTYGFEKPSVIKQFDPSHDWGGVDQAASELLKLGELIDLVIPRGNNKLVSQIKASTKIPVLSRVEGICHVCVDKSTNTNMAKQIVLEAKMDFPVACNVMDTTIVHKDLIQNGALNELIRELQIRVMSADDLGVVTHDTITRAYLETEKGFTDCVTEMWPTRPNFTTVEACCLVGVIYQQTLFVANLGDSCVVLGKKMGEYFEKYSQFVVQMMQGAAEVCANLDNADEEMMEYGNQQRRSIFEAYFGILHGFKNTKADLILLHAANMLQFIQLVSNDKPRDESVIKAAVAILGDRGLNFLSYILISTLRTRCFLKAWGMIQLMQVKINGLDSVVAQMLSTPDNKPNG